MTMQERGGKFYVLGEGGDVLNQKPALTREAGEGFEKAFGHNTCREVGNQHGLLCPNCGKGTGIVISARVEVEARLYPDGTENDGGDTTWGDDSDAHCVKCDWRGEVRDLMEVEMFD